MEGLLTLLSDLNHNLLFKKFKKLNQYLHGTTSGQGI